MFNLPLEIAEMFGQTIAKVVPITIVLALVFSVLAHLGPASRKRRGGAARTRHRHCTRFFVPLLRARARIVAGARRRLILNHERTN